MVSSRTRDHVWQGLLDMARYRLYYGSLERGYRNKFYAVRFLLAVAGVGATVPLIDGAVVPPIDMVPDWLTAFAGVAVVVLVIWDIVFDYGEKAALLGVAVERLDELEMEHRSLWEELDEERLDDEQARMRMTDLHKAALDAVRGIRISLDDKLNDECQANAFKIEENRYAAG